MNLKIIPTIKCESVDESIAYHPDIVLHPVNHNTLIVAPEVFDYYYNELNLLGIRLIKGTTNLGNLYPLDISYNVGRVGKYAFHKLQYTDPILRSYLNNQNIDFVNINQGYSKCSMAIINDSSIITADKNIHLKLLELGYDSLLIEAGYVELKKQKYGFFGGATGNLTPDKILFSGHIDDHPDKIKIIDFIKQKHVDIIYLSKEKITDIGTIICLNKG
ncbi:MAG: hypothetical protein GX787_05995 [Tissierellia bacterium]|nr:hypothetical protein [Tissierellia bacterium]